MKKFLTMFAFAAMLIGLTACNDDDENPYRTYDVTVQLVDPEVGETTLEGVEVKATAATGTETLALTDATGTAYFSLPEDMYTFTATILTSQNGKVNIVNYSSSATISKETMTGGQGFSVSISPVVSQGAQQLLIKEYYYGGCPKDDGSGTYSAGQYVTLYNNSAIEARVKNLGYGTIDPTNAHGNNKNYIDGELYFEHAGYTPSWAGVWYYPHEIVVEPYGEITIALTGAIDNTQTYSQSVNLSNADYACYDPEGAWTSTMNATYYPTPTESITSDRWFKVSFHAMGNACGTNNTSPGFFIFAAGDTDVHAYASDTANQIYPGGVTSASSVVNLCIKVKNEWILDAVDVWLSGKESTSKDRFSAAVNVGHIVGVNKLGYTIYRNVDKEATEALAENEGKLVYNYAGGVTSGEIVSTDPSTIDAEASMKNGAHIIFQETNNSANDFHLRAKSSLRN